MNSFSQDKRPFIDTWLAPSLFGIAALALRLWHLDYDSIWFDEGFTAYHSTLPALQHWTQPVVNKPPFFYHLVSLAWSPGDGAFWLRFPAALFGSATVVLAWFFGRALGGKKTAFWFAFFLLIASQNIKYSQEARHYIVLALGWLAIAFSLWRLVSCVNAPHPPRKALIGFAIGAFLMIHTHPIAIIYLAAAALSYLLALRLAGPLRVAWVIQPLLICLVIGLSIMPWIRVMPTGFDWLTQVSLSGAISATSKLASGGAVIAFLSVLGLFKFYRRSNRPQGALLLCLFVLPPLLIWLTGFIKPMFMLRTVVPAHTIAILGLALFVAGIQRQRLSTLTAALISCAMAYQTYGYYAKPGKENWQALAEAWQAKAGPDEIMLLDTPDRYVPIHFYLGDKMPVAYTISYRADGSPVMLDAGSNLQWGCAPPACQPPISPATPADPKVLWIVKRGDKIPPDIGRYQSDLKGLYGTLYHIDTIFRDRGVWLFRMLRNSE